MPSTAIAAPVTNVAAPLGPASAGAANSDRSAASEGSGLISADFASLLLTQMGSNLKGNEPVALNLDAKSKDDSSDDAASGNSGDMSALFAALNLAATLNPQQAIPTPLPATTAKATVEALQPGGTGNQTPLLEHTDANAALPAATNDASAIPTTQANTGGNSDGDPTEGKAASFAAFDAALKQAEAKTDTSAPVMPDAPPVVHNVHQAHGTANTPQIAQARVDTPVRDPAFGHEFSQKIVWLAGQDKQSAQLSLNPPQLGPVEVSLKITGDQATAVFSSPHAEVREAIEAALPRLREMMGSAGLELGQANVSSQSFQQQQQAAQQQASNSRGNSSGGILATDSGETGSVKTRVIQQGNGLVDTFA